MNLLINNDILNINKNSNQLKKDLLIPKIRLKNTVKIFDVNKLVRKFLIIKNPPQLSN